MPDDLADPKGRAIARKMRPWFRAKDGFPDMRAPSPGERTPEQRIWDHAIFAASEFVRRYEGHNEGISRSLHLLLSDMLPDEDSSSSPHPASAGPSAGPPRSETT